VNGSIDPSRIALAATFINALQRAVHEREMPADLRVRASAPCFGVAMDHHHAIVVLLERGLYATAAALVRVAFDAYCRGQWLAHCATDPQRDQFLADKDPFPKFSDLLADIEARPEFALGTLSKIKGKSWGAMCSYTHTGGLQVQRWITAESIEPNYPTEELLEVLWFAEFVGQMAAIGFAELAGSDEMARQVWAAFEAHQAALPPPPPPQ
jgi:hypothetical protein